MEPVSPKPENVNEDKETNVNEEKEAQKAEQALAREIQRYKQDLKNLSKNELIRMVIGLTVEVHHYQKISDKIEELKSKSQDT